MPKIFSYYSDELLFKFSIDETAGANEPSWQETDDYPPLPPRKAIEISKLTLLLILKDYPWAGSEFHSCALKRTSDYEGAGGTMT